MNFPENLEKLFNVRALENHVEKDKVIDATPSLGVDKPERKIDYNGDETKINSSVIDWRDQFMKQVKIGMDWAKESLRKDLKSHTSAIGNSEEEKVGDWIGQLQNQIFTHAGLSKQPLKDDIFPVGNIWNITADKRKNVGELRDLWGRQITKAKNKDSKIKNVANNVYNDADTKNLLSILERDKDRKKTETSTSEGVTENPSEKHYTLEGRRDAWEKRIIESEHFLNKKYQIPQRTTMGDLRDKWQKQIVNNEELMNRTFPKYNKPRYNKLIELAMKSLSSRSSQSGDDSNKSVPPKVDKYDHMQENFKHRNDDRYRLVKHRAEGQPKQKRSLVFNTKETDLDTLYGTKSNLSLTRTNNKSTEKIETNANNLTDTQKLNANENQHIVNDLATGITTTAPISLDKLNNLTVNATKSMSQSKTLLPLKDTTQNKKSLNEKLVKTSNFNFNTNSENNGLHFPPETTVPLDNLSRNSPESNMKPTKFAEVLKSLAQTEPLSSQKKATTPLPKQTKVKGNKFDNIEMQEKPLSNQVKRLGEPLELTLPGRIANAKEFTERKDLLLDNKVFTLASQLPDQSKSLIRGPTDFQYDNKNFPSPKPFFTEESETSLEGRHMRDPNFFFKRDGDKNINQQNFDETNSYSQLQHFPQLKKTVSEDKHKNVNDRFFTGTDLAKDLNNVKSSDTYSDTPEHVPLMDASSKGIADTVKDLFSKGMHAGNEKLSQQDKDISLGRHLSYDRNYALESNTFPKLTDSILSGDFLNESGSFPFSNREREAKQFTEFDQFQPNMQTTNKPINEFFKKFDGAEEMSTQFVVPSEAATHPQVNLFSLEDHDANAAEDLSRVPTLSRMFNSMNLFGSQTDEFLGSKRTINHFVPMNDEQDVMKVSELPLELENVHQKVKSRPRNGEEMVRFLTKMLDDKPIVIPKRFGKIGKNYGSVSPQENERKLQEIEEEKRKGSKLLAMSPKINVRKFYDTLASVLAADRNVWQQQFVENPFADVILAKFKDYLPIAFKQTKMNTSYSIKYPKSQELDLTITNVIGVLPGRKEGLPTDEFTIIGAHYDSADNVENSEEFHNSASGITLLLEILRALATSEWQLENSIYFVAFDLGEVDRVGSSHFVKHYLIPKVIESGRGTLKGAYILNTLMAYNSTPESQRLPYEVTEFAPQVAAAVSKEENKGDFYLVSARKSVDNELSDKLFFYWSLTPNPNFKIYVAEVNLTEVKRHKMHSVFNDGDHRNFWDAGEAQDHVLKAVHVGDTEYARASGECYDTDCQAFSTITPSSLLFVKKLGEALIASLLDFGGGILAEFRTPLRRAILPPGRTRRIRRGRFAIKSPGAIGVRFRRRRSHPQLT